MKFEELRIVHCCVTEDCHQTVRGVDILCQDLLDMKILSVLFKTYNNMLIPVQCLFTKHVALRPSPLRCQYVLQCV